ncbi:MAG: protein kinase [Planctomycetes bacterium]|nr:protein kinase [Planctomycetota bacterium]
MPDESQDAPTQRFEFRPDDPDLAGEGPFREAGGDAASRLPSRYVVEAEIGHGGMGTVYRVRDRILRRRIAVKVLHVSLAANEESRDRFIEEAQVASQLQHPNIVPVYDVGLDGADAHPYFTMRLVDGQTLTEILARRAREGSPSLVRLLQVFLDVCRAVHYAHVKGVLHRDLKPDNVMVGPFGEVYVMDWGVAKLVGSAAEGVSTREKDRKESGVVSSRSISGEATWDGVVVGTPAFMPPEQAEGDMGSLGPWSDVYALGAILYKVLTLRAPYTGDTASEILRRVQAEAPTPPREVRHDVPRDLEAICLKAMAREPQDRYPGPDALAEDIQRWFEGVQVRARPVSLLERAGRWAHRRRYPLSVGVVLGLVVILAMPGFLRRRLALLRPQVVVVGVEPGSVAEEIGLVGGDVILRYGDREVESVNELAAAIHGAEASGAASVRLVLRRDTALLERDVRPGRLGIRTMNVRLYLKEK